MRRLSHLLTLIVATALIAASAVALTPSPPVQDLNQLNSEIATAPTPIDGQKFDDGTATRGLGRVENTSEVAKTASGASTTGNPLLYSNISNSHDKRVTPIDGQFRIGLFILDSNNSEVIGGGIEAFRDVSYSGDYVAAWS